jgi:hypothetical protein
VNHPKSLLLLALTALLLWAAIAPTAAPADDTPDGSPALAAVPLDAAPFGLNTHLATRYPDPSSMAVPAERVLQSGAGWAREDIHWWRIQPTPSTWDWTFTDEAMRELIRRKINIVGVIGHPPGWATAYPYDPPRDISFYAPDQQQFVRFAEAVASRYGRYIHHWEIWNEPDNPVFWRPAPDPRAYTALLRDTAAAIRRIDPQAKILIGGLNPFDTSFLQGVADAGGWPSFDILAIHPYVDPAAPEAGSIGASADGVRALAKRYGERPIWVTEIGWSSGPGDRDRTGQTSAQQQADYLVRATLLLWRAGIERIFWYTLKDDPGNPYGLFTLGAGRADYSQPKPAFAAFQTLSRQLGGSRLVGMHDLFKRTNIFSFDYFGAWRRGDQPNGELVPSDERARSGMAARLSYSFPGAGNDYVVFVRDRPIDIPDQTYALGLWVYGDGSGNQIKLWLRDAQGELLQYQLGAAGAPGWRFLQAQLAGTQPDWNRVSKGGNGQLDFPASLYALVVDDAPDSFAGGGTIYLDDLTALSGPEAYDLQLQRGDQALDVLWATAPLRARLPSSAAEGLLVGSTGQEQRLPADQGALTLDLGPAPVYVQHRR